MKPNLAHPVGRLRLCGMLEAVSFLILLGIAMPLKYALHLPQAVKYAGWAHGFLFVLFCLTILTAWLERKISFKHAALAFAASLIPLGPFLIDRKLANDEQQSDAAL